MNQPPYLAVMYAIFANENGVQVIYHPPELKDSKKKVVRVLA
jgi:hypothetical protein